MEPKVLFTASSWSHISNFHRPYLAEFRRLGWRVDVACGGRAVTLPEAHRHIPVPFEKSMTAPQNLSALRLLRREITREGYALVITHTALASFFTRMAVRGMAPRPRVVSVCHGYLFDDHTSAAKRALLLGAEQLTAPNTDLLLTMNDWDYQLAKHHRLSKRVANIPGMGVDFARFPPLPHGGGDALRGEFGFGTDDFLLLYAAEFSPRKNQAMLLRTLAKLPQQVGLLLPGDGAQLGRCKALAAELGLEKRVVFPGQVGDMSRWYGAASCAVSASRSEGLPFHIMEAMHMGLPVVASAVKGHVDLIEDGASGLLFPFGDEGQLAAHIRTLLDGPDICHRLSVAARQQVAQYNLPVVLPQVMAAYIKVLPWDAAQQDRQPEPVSS